MTCPLFECVCHIYKISPKPFFKAFSPVSGSSWQWTQPPGAHPSPASAALLRLSAAAHILSVWEGEAEKENRLNRLPESTLCAIYAHACLLLRVDFLGGKLFQSQEERFCDRKTVHLMSLKLRLSGLFKKIFIVNMESLSLLCIEKITV